MEKYVPAIRCFSMVGKSQVIGWVQHRNYNWKYVRDIGQPAVINDGAIIFSDLNQDGTYFVEWRFCSSGSIAAIDTVPVSNGIAAIAVPPIQWDYAFKMTFGGTSVKKATDNSPRQFNLRQNFPNPFNTDTVIQYSIPSAGLVKVTIYDLNGKIVRNFKRYENHAGRFNEIWDGRDNRGEAVSSGVYIYQVKFNDKYQAVRRMVLLK